MVRKVGLNRTDRKIWLNEERQKIRANQADDKGENYIPGLAPTKKGGKKKKPKSPTKKGQHSHAKKDENDNEEAPVQQTFKPKQRAGLSGGLPSIPESEDTESLVWTAGSKSTATTYDIPTRPPPPLCRTSPWIAT